jgi:electron transport complex protein RnfC
MDIQEINLKAPRWGIRFTRPTASAGGLPLRALPVTDRLIVSLHQNIGAPAQPLVEPGDTVLKGQPVGTAAPGERGAPVHAPTSGVVTAIEPHAVPGHASALCVHIRSDGEDRAWPGYTALAEPLSAAPTELRMAVAAAGIVGLGGALFPTSEKLDAAAGIKTLVLNGVECEPRINCDDALMRHRPREVLLGAQIMLRILAADDCVIALKSDTLMAIQEMRAALRQLGDSRIRLALVPPVYPAGGEAQLLQLLTGQEIPAGGLPRDIGTVCQNVGTAAAIARFLTSGEPLISRIVTVTGSGVASPVNIEARIGTPLHELIRFAGGYTADEAQLVMGGPMMGVGLPDDSLPVTKACNCIYVQANEATRPAPTAMPCIRCGDCATVCPVALTPQLLLQHQRTDDFERLEQLGLADCIECGCCDYVCPSHIPLTQNFIGAKQELRDIAREKQQATQAAVRFNARTQRLQEKAELLDQELAAQIEKIENVAANEMDDKDLLRKLLQRVDNADRDNSA